MYKPTVQFDEVKNISVEEYFANNSYSVDIFNAKYAMYKEDGTKETPAEVFFRIANSLANMEKNLVKASYYKDVWFSLMWEGWFRPGGSVMSSIGSNRKSSMCNCTTIPLYEDTLESIAQCEYDVMKCAAYRQGIGIDFSNLRPRGSKLNNAACESTGVVSWMDKINRVGDYVGQQGRKPALLESLIVSHPDIEEFISCKDDLKKINNANISVQITNDFMAAVKADKEWELRFEVKGTGEVVTKTVNAKKLFSDIATRAWKTAEPGIQYRNLLQNSIMYKAIYDHIGDERFLPHSSNACSEKFMAPYSVCNLSSCNMENFSIIEEGYTKELEVIVPLMVRMADNVIDYELCNNLSPVPQQRWIVEQLREIGMGITNLHGWLLKQNLAYDSEEAIVAVEKFMKCYAHQVFKASMELGEEKGDAAAFRLIEDKNLYMNTTYFNNMVNEFFDGDATKVRHMRNMAHMSIAPAGSLSSTFPSPCISSGIEPVMGLYYWRRTRAIDKGNYTHYFMMPDRLREYVMSKMDPESNDYERFVSFGGATLDEDGKYGLAIIDIIKKYVPEGFFKPAHEIDPQRKIKLMSAVYKWLDASISCTYNLPSSATVADVENIYMSAYDNGVRAVSVYVDGSREGILLFEDPITNKNKFDSKPTQSLCSPENRPTRIMPVCAPKRPDSLECSIHHCSVKGIPWLVIIGLMDGDPYEIFAGEVEEGLYVPKTCKAGKIVKKGGGKYSLEITIRQAEVEYKDLAHVLMTSNQRALTRLLSLALRHGTPLEFIQQQLRKANGEITDFSAVVARVLGSYIKQYKYEKSSNVCPECGEVALIRSESCIKCTNCAYSRCD
ncbi:MAG TPA: ribonucleotide reductase N-terminal alpha domain-containing protein [Patescibacteria group bacterium]|nr:ribonucleotide reductase N-terminal alpha domain-containing protein [Patescibacteria group bacterium]